MYSASDMQTILRSAYSAGFIHGVVLMTGIGIIIFLGVGV